MPHDNRIQLVNIQVQKRIKIRRKNKKMYINLSPIWSYCIFKPISCSESASDIQFPKDWLPLSVHKFRLGNEFPLFRMAYQVRRSRLLYGSAYCMLYEYSFYSLCYSLSDRRNSGLLTIPRNTLVFERGFAGNYS